MANKRASAYDDSSIRVLSLQTGQVKEVLSGGYFPRYLATSKGSGYLVYIHQGTLFGQSLDQLVIAPFNSVPLLVDLGWMPVGEDRRMPVVPRPALDRVAGLLMQPVDVLRNQRALLKSPLPTRSPQTRGRARHRPRRAFCLLAFPEDIQLHGGTDAMDTGRT